jgi:hypothetical protein
MGARMFIVTFGAAMMLSCTYACAQDTNRVLGANQDVSAVDVSVQAGVGELAKQAAKSKRPTVAGRFSLHSLRLLGSGPFRRLNLPLQQMLFIAHRMVLQDVSRYRLLIRSLRLMGFQRRSAKNSSDWPAFPLSRIRSHKQPFPRAGTVPSENS